MVSDVLLECVAALSGAAGVKGVQGVLALGVGLDVDQVLGIAGVLALIPLEAARAVLWFASRART
jgi:hypothetical protein